MFVAGSSLWGIQNCPSHATDDEINQITLLFNPLLGEEEMNTELSYGYLRESKRNTTGHNLNHVH